MLTVVTQSSNVDYSSTAALRELVLGATATSTMEDAYLSRLIRRASRWADDFVGYPLSLQTYQEACPSYGTRRLMLSRTPIVAVDRVFDATDTGTASQLTSTEYSVGDRDAGFLTRLAGWPWSATLQAKAPSWQPGGLGIPLDPAPIPGDEYEPWLVDYRAGYTLDGVEPGSANWSTANGTTSTGRTLPEDVEQAVLMRAQWWHDKIQDGVTSEKLGDLSVTYNGSSANADPPFECLLAPYRRWK